MNAQDEDLRRQVLDIGAGCFALQARKTANLIARVYNHAVAGLGLEMSQFSTLFLIAAGGGETVSDAARLLGVERSTLVRNLALLQRDKLIVKSEGGSAGYRLTSRGRALTRQAVPRWAAVQRQIEDALELPGERDPRPGMKALRAAARGVSSISDTR
ncbi:MarR family winged helix-turn-helix transcriptional regulator [Terrarubrum flagellatum]|uniref:MarR family winged helix-turn-helix transcriptional regulator n=1 Tax=Terrirubrum flagellatum TaxID=2895980 RepID=UPI0031452595